MSAAPDQAAADAADSDELTIEALEHWLQSLLPESFEGARVSSIDRISRGVSRETWTFDVVSESTAPRTLILRRDLAGGSIDASPLRQEYEIYRALADSDVPVVEVLAYDDDLSRCPNQRPAYLRTHVDGHWMPERFDDPDPQWNARRVEICRAHIRALATVHDVDWQALGFADILPVPTDAEHAAHHLIDLHEGHLAEAALVAHPVVTRGIARLRETAPAATDLRLVKGTNGLGEEVFARTELVAMSDWELAAIGDPAYDFAQLQGFIDRIEHDGEIIWSLDHALDYYRQLTGRTIERATVKWYRTLYGLVMFTFASRAARALAEGRDQQARLAWVAIEMQHHGQARLGAAFGIRAERPTNESKGH